MGYDLNITRTSDSAEGNEIPIPLEEAKAFVASDPELNWVTSATFAGGEPQISFTVKAQLIEWRGDVCFWWFEGRISGGSREEKAAIKLAEMAKALGAKLLGDDGEEYVVRRNLFGRKSLKIMTEAHAAHILQPPAKRPTEFVRLSCTWNADPNAPDEEVLTEGDALRLRFNLNAVLYTEFTGGDWAEITFDGSEQWRLGSTNDEGWYRGQCRFSGIAPGWGEFYELLGDAQLDDPRLTWTYLIRDTTPDARHFLFYFRDQTFECRAQDWKIEFHSEPRK